MVVQRSRAPLGVLLLAHGARTSRTAAEVAEVASAVAARRPSWRLSVGYIELTPPPFVEPLTALAAQCERVVVAPLFLFRAGHLLEDLPAGIERVRARFPDTPITVADPLGLTPPVIELAAVRVAAVAAGLAADTVLVVAGRGSSHPRANGDLYKAARLVAERLDLPTTLPTFVGVTRPRLATTLLQAARLGSSVVVLPYLLFFGRISERVRTAVATASADHPGCTWALAGTLGPDPRLADAVVAGVEAVLAATPTTSPRTFPATQTSERSSPCP